MLELFFQSFYLDSFIPNIDNQKENGLVGNASPPAPPWKNAALLNLLNVSVLLNTLQTGCISLKKNILQQLFLKINKYPKSSVLQGSPLMGHTGLGDRHYNI